MLHSIPRLIYGFYIYRFLRHSYFHVAIGLIYFQSHGLSLSEALSLESVYYITKALTDIPGGYFADQMGRKVSLLTSSVLCAAAYAIIGMGSSYTVFAAAEVMLGLAMSLSTTSDSALLFDELKARSAEDRYERAEGRGWAMRNLGFGAASAAGAWLAALTDLSVPFLLSSAAIMLSMAFMFFFVHEPHFNPARGTRSWLTQMWVVLRRRSFVPVILFFALAFVAVRIGFWSFQPMLEELGITLSSYGILFAIFLCISLVSALQVRWTKRLRGGPWSTLTLLTTGCFFVLGAGAYLGGTIGMAITMLGFGIHAVAQGVYDPVMRKEINDISDSAVRASAMAVATMLGNVVFAAVAPLYGWSVETYGHGVSFTAIGIGLIMLAGPLGIAVAFRGRPAPTAPLAQSGTDD